MAMSILIIGCSSKISSQKPKLVVMISVDQMRADYLDIFSTQFEGGLKYLIENSIYFSNHHHNHFNTLTAPGHATMATGFNPSNNGITSNYVYDRRLKTNRYIVIDTSVRFIGINQCNLKKNSAKNLLKPTLGDIIKQQDPKSMSYSVSLKDRASILMGGHQANRAFWFDAQSTQMVSTDFYSEEFPTWAKTFTGKRIMKNELEQGWILDEEFSPAIFPGQDTIEEETGFFNAYFPHTREQNAIELKSTKQEGDFLWNTPFGDAFVLKFAAQLVIQQQLGLDNHTDMLNVSLSAADYIGHHFGPNSYEIQDCYQKLDRYLSSFMMLLNDQVGPENYLLALTSDHGVAPFPEIVKQQGIRAKRVTKDRYRSDIDSIDQIIQRKFKLSSPAILHANYSGIEPNFNYLRNNQLDSNRVINEILMHVKNLDYVAETYTFTDIKDSMSNKAYIQQVRNSHRPEHGYFIKILSQENYLIDAKEHGTTHGSPYSYDTHVPLFLMGPNIIQRVDSSRTYTVDIVPTILSYLDIKTTIEFDGKPLDITENK